MAKELTREEAKLELSKRTLRNLTEISDFSLELGYNMARYSWISRIGESGIVYLGHNFPPEVCAKMNETAILIAQAISGILRDINTRELQLDMAFRGWTREQIYQMQKDWARSAPYSRGDLPTVEDLLSGKEASSCYLAFEASVKIYRERFAQRWEEYNRMNWDYNNPQI